MTVNKVRWIFLLGAAFLAVFFSDGFVMAQPVPSSDANITLRGQFQNARLRFEKEKKGHVAYIGGSITQMNGYRPMVMAILKRRFPATKFTFTAAGISSTCSTTGAFRLQKHVLSKGPVDLFFIEFAVNDDQDAGHSSRDCIRGMEGIIRHTRLHNPNADVVITYFVNPSMLKLWQIKKTPLSVKAHERVAQHYLVPAINLAKETAEQITDGKLTWKQYGGTHPKPHGNKLCAAMIDRLMSNAWKKPIAATAKPIAHSLPKSPLDSESYFRGRLIEPNQAKNLKGFSLQTPNWSKIRGSCRRDFLKSELLCAEKSGSEASLKFNGTAVGAYILAGPDAGIVEVSVDRGPYRSVNLYHRFSRGLHYPRTVMFATDLKLGPHTLRIRMAQGTDARSRGHAMRVLYFVAN
jgi:lysophospholipase L1-like esterase